MKDSVQTMSFFKSSNSLVKTITVVFPPIFNIYQQVTQLSDYSPTFVCH